MVALAHHRVEHVRQQQEAHHWGLRRVHEELHWGLFVVVRALLLGGLTSTIVFP